MRHAWRPLDDVFVPLVTALLAESPAPPGRCPARVSLTASFLSEHLLPKPELVRQVLGCPFDGVPTPARLQTTSCHAADDKADTRAAGRRTPGIDRALRARIGHSCP